MRMSCGFLAALPLAALLSGCGGSDGANDDRRAQASQSNAAPEAPAQRTVALAGCIQTGPGTNQYVLRHVRFQEDHASESQATTTTSAAHGITEGSWVRLSPGDQDLDGFAGQRVSLTGVVTDTGQNTIGTAGTSGLPTPSGDRSMAAGKGDPEDRVAAEAGRIARESMANGAAPEIRVEQVQGTGERCETQQERRRE